MSIRFGYSWKAFVDYGWRGKLESGSKIESFQTVGKFAQARYDPGCRITPFTLKRTEI